VELFKAFGAPVPQYAHIPLILKDPRLGKGKMSKRDHGALVAEYQDRCFVPEALVNFLSLLGWSPGDDREKMPVDEIVRLFDFPGINQSNARFDEQKLAHMNARYLWELPPERYLAIANDYFTRKGVFGLGPAPDDAYFREVLLLAQPKIKGIEELPGYTAYFFTDEYPTDPKASAKILAKGEPKARLGDLLAWARSADFSSDEALEQSLNLVVTAQGLGLGDYVHVGRLALSGTNVGPSFFGLCRVLGRDRTVRRLERFVAALPGN
jgi:glutamyl-tRNA synthetase